MRRIVAIVLGSMLYFASYAQNSFQAGYYIDNSGQRLEGLIQMDSWRFNPTEFNFKLNKTSKVEAKTINTVKEFGLGFTAKYIRATVKIDKSSNRIQSLTDEKEPLFVEETLFLKVLFEGEAFLFEYKDKSITRYFYSTENQEIEQLVYKKYYTEKNVNSLQRKVDENNSFKAQLWNTLNCENLALEDVKKLTYRSEDLIEYFTSYSECLNQSYVSYKQKAKDSFNFTLRPHFNYSSLRIDNGNSLSIINVEFDNEVNIGFGVEFEYILPLYKQNWSVILEPNYQAYASKKQTSSNLVSDGILNIEVGYSALKTPFGVRYYFHLNNKSKLFINAISNVSFYLRGINDSALLIYSRGDGSIINTIEYKRAGLNYGFGGGYKFNNKYSIELRYLEGQNLIQEFVRDSNYRTLSLMLGYTL